MQIIFHSPFFVQSLNSVIRVIYELRIPFQKKSYRVNKTNFLRNFMNFLEILMFSQLFWGSLPHSMIQITFLVL